MANRSNAQHISKGAVDVEREITKKAVCRRAQKQRKNQNSPKRNRAGNDNNKNFICGSTETVSGFLLY